MDDHDRLRIELEATRDLLMALYRTLLTRDPDLRTDFALRVEGLVHFAEQRRSPERKAVYLDALEEIKTVHVLPPFFKAAE